VRDGGYSWQPATAFLDTGNQHKTIIDTDYARRHAIYRPASEAAAIFGEATGSFGQAESWTTVNGVVPGASVRAPVVTIGLKIRGEEYLIPAIVSEMKGHDLLLGVDVLTRLFNSGFQIGAGSV
jgi:predicted aspartyl protease